MRAFYPRGVRARLCLAFTLTAAVVGIGGSLLFVHVVRIGIANNLENNLEARAQTIAGVLDGTAPPKLPDPLIDAGTRAVAQATTETFAVVRRPDGMILTATGAPPPQHLVLPEQILQLQDGGLARDHAHPGRAALPGGRAGGEAFGRHLACRRRHVTAGQ